MTEWPQNHAKRKMRLTRQPTLRRHMAAAAGLAAALAVTLALHAGPAGANIPPAPPIGVEAFGQHRLDLPILVRLDGAVADPEAAGWRAGKGPHVGATTTGRFIGAPVAAPAIMAALAPTATAAEPDRRGLAAGRPDDDTLFGTVAIPMARTIHAAAWSRALSDQPGDRIDGVLGDALRGRCESGGPLCRLTLLGRARRMLEETRERPLDARIRSVNRFVNHAIRFEDDIVGHGVADHWATATETLMRGRGDCEDIAILKMALLKAAGVPSAALVLVLGREQAGGRDHAVLVVRRPSAPAVVLDNLTDVITPAADSGQLLPMLSFSSAGSWLHGRRMARPSIPPPAGEETLAARAPDRVSVAVAATNAPQD